MKDKDKSPPTRRPRPESATPPRKRARHLRVPVFADEADLIEAGARRANMSVAAYLREVGQGYQIRGVVDAEQVRELARINGDLGRLGGLLKLWLTDDERTASFGEATIRALLGRIERNQEEMAAIMKSVIRPRASQDATGDESFSG